jgi:hypothetical protein
VISIRARPGSMAVNFIPTIEGNGAGGSSPAIIRRAFSSIVGITQKDAACRVPG